jgi:hypothetical protein
VNQAEYATEFATVFTAAAPRPELADELSLFAPLIGSWDLVVFEYGRDGEVTRSTAEWHFSWALDGRAVADVWINPRRADRGPDSDGEWGLSLRFYDSDIDAWRSTWHGPYRGWVIPFVARPAGDGIVLEGERDGTALRWIFSEMGAGSFRWRAEETGPDGETLVRQRFEATRATVQGGNAAPR